MAESKKMTKVKKVGRNFQTGRYTVRSKGKTAQGSTAWEIAGLKGYVPKVVVTTAASMAAIDRIMVKHSKALKRLAKK